MLGCAAQHSAAASTRPAEWCGSFNYHRCARRVPPTPCLLVAAGDSFFLPKHSFRRHAPHSVMKPPMTAAVMAGGGNRPKSPVCLQGRVRSNPPRAPLTGSSSARAVRPVLITGRPKARKKGGPTRQWSDHSLPPAGTAPNDGAVRCLKANPTEPQLFSAQLVRRRTSLPLLPRRDCGRRRSARWNGVLGAVQTTS